MVFLKTHSTRCSFSFTHHDTRLSCVLLDPETYLCHVTDLLHILFDRNSSMKSIAARCVLTTQSDRSIANFIRA